MLESIGKYRKQLEVRERKIRRLEERLRQRPAGTQKSRKHEVTLRGHDKRIERLEAKLGHALGSVADRQRYEEMVKLRDGKIRQLEDHIAQIKREEKLRFLERDNAKLTNEVKQLRAEMTRLRGGR